MKTIGVIPCRYKSQRFPGKPIADILGKPICEDSRDAEDAGCAAHSSMPTTRT